MTPSADDSSPGRARRWPGVLALPLVVLVWLVFVVAPIWIQAAHACFAHFDLGIYTQALARMSLTEPNPWLSARQVYIFNDHFDPILWVVRPLVAVLPPMWASLVGEALLVLLAVAPLLWLQARGLLSRAATGLLAAFLLLAPSAVEALKFPIHPTTWSALPWVMTGVAFHLRRNGWLLVSLVLLFTCKEEFAFVGIMLTVALWLRGERRFAVGVGVLSLLWLAGVYGLRPWLLGPSEDYGVRLRQGMEGGLLHYLALRLAPVHLSRMGTLVLLLLPLGVWAWRERLKPDWAWLLVLLPMLGIRFLGMAWRFHYAVPLLAAALMGFLPVLRARKPPAWVLVSTGLVLLFSNELNLRQFTRTLVSSRTYPRQCPGDPERLASIARGVDVLARHREGLALLGSNFVSLLADRDDIYAVGGPQPDDGRVYEWVLVEKPPHGEVWPLSYDRMRELIDAWRAEGGTQIVIDDANVFLARGRFTAHR
ncbi:DUF2079 domain-containing protein [Myxococcus llanfairpwllgwyngyllgogerychwyrndrobwllllantysiliogogogochensis]|uniref:DUF2079 domain-containing protein n=1 Tax=Myxococcus llanfairpwllgwyngyllgogerychwyrndrobwllllantysiliogogogochensis TaxID=2590453 RepID=UPI0015F10BA2|nr:DUF2079 domain-containing protein [Myxococcus llanfairpwllgwyngyllgogerychwyrndrobwllllantysiliogogogochensis]